VCRHLVARFVDAVEDDGPTGFKHKLFELRALKSKALLHKAFLVSMLMSCAQ
jgi:hypothetical protein